MEQDTGTADGSAVVDQGSGREPTAEELARVADELLQHVSALRREYEQLNDALAETTEAPSDPPAREGHGADDDGRGHDNIRAMALQMALAGDSRETAKEYLSDFEVDGVDPIVDDVFDRTEAQRKPRRRRIFSRRAD
jgi:hypothetical protein